MPSVKTIRVSFFLSLGLCCAAFGQPGNCVTGPVNMNTFPALQENPRVELSALCNQSYSAFGWPTGTDPNNVVSRLYDIYYPTALGLHNATAPIDVYTHAGGLTQVNQDKSERGGLVSLAAALAATG